MTAGEDNPTQATRKPPGCWLRCRAIQTVALAAVMTAGMGLAREQKESGLPPDLLWQLKVQWNANADVVLAGDSRVYRGLSPERFSAVLGNCRVLNFGFSSAGYSPKYLAGIQRVLDPQSHCPIIVMGITPHSLTPDAAKDNGYLHALGVQRDRPPPATEAILARHCPEVLYFFKPMKPREMLRTALGIHHRKKSRYLEFYRFDGWVPGRLIPEDSRRGLKAYRSVFNGNKVSDEAVWGILEAVTQWTRRGISVYGFRPPTTAEMVALENARSGFDEAKFAADFVKVGGQWIAVDQERYHSCDSSHLRDDAAAMFSTDLARRIDKLRRLADDKRPRSQQGPRGLKTRKTKTATRRRQE